MKAQLVLDTAHGLPLTGAKNVGREREWKKVDGNQPDQGIWTIFRSSLRPIGLCFLLASHIIWIPQSAPTSHPLCPLLLTHLLTSREMLQFWAREPGSQEARAPLYGSPSRWVSSELLTWKIRIVSCTGVRTGGALSQCCPKLDESSNNPQSQQEQNCLIKLPIDFSWILINSHGARLLLAWLISLPSPRHVRFLSVSLSLCNTCAQTHCTLRPSHAHAFSHTHSVTLQQGQETEMHFCISASHTP